MNNIFENACFGKIYRTRDGSKAIYIGKSRLYKTDFKIAYENSTSLGRVTANGRYWTESDVDSDHDIISEWQEPINDKELNKFVKISTILDKLILITIGNILCIFLLAFLLYIK